MGILFLMLAPNLDNFLPRIGFESTCRQIASDISLMRLRAVERRETTSLTFNAGNKSYTMQPYGLRRDLPDEIASVAFPDISFNSRGFLASGNGVTLNIVGRHNRRCTMTISAAGRTKITYSTVP